MTSHAPSYHGYRFPPEIIGHAAWLYHRFCLSFRDAVWCKKAAQVANRRCKARASLWSAPTDERYIFGYYGLLGF